LAISGDRQLVAANSGKDSITLWELATGKEVRRIMQPHAERSISPFLMAITFSPDGKYLLAGQSERTRQQSQLALYLFEVGPGKAIHRYGQPNEGARHLSVEPPLAAFSPDGKRVTLVESGRIDRDASIQVCIWEVDTGKELRQLRAPP